MSVKAMMDKVCAFLATIPQGPIANPGDLERLLAACWHEFGGDDGGMTGEKLGRKKKYHRLQKVEGRLA